MITARPHRTQDKSQEQEEPMTRRPPAQEPSLFDAVEAETGDAWTRAGWQPTPGVPETDLVPETLRRAPRRGKTGAPHDIHPEELAALAAHARDRWASLVAAARARIDNPQEGDR
jgi:hypothetical protein